MQHLIGRIVFLTRGKSDTRHLIGCQVLRPASEPNLFRAFSVGKSQYTYNKTRNMTLTKLFSYINVTVWQEYETEE